MRGRDDIGDGTTAGLLQALANGDVQIYLLTEQGDNNSQLISGLVIEFAHDAYEGSGNRLTLNFATSMTALDFFAIAGTIDNGVITDYNLDFTDLRLLDITKLADILCDSLSYESYVIDKTADTGTAYGSDLSDELLLGQGITQAYAFGGDDIIDIQGTTTSVDGREGTNTLQVLDVRSLIQLSDLATADNIQNLTTNASFIVRGDDGNNIIDVRQKPASLAGPTTNGSNGHDVIYGGDIDNHFTGGEGNDYLFGGKGDDLLAGGEGQDSLYGGAGHDVLQGKNGIDWLFGGKGQDTLAGSDGADRFVLGDVGDGTDTVPDFQAIDRVIVQRSAPLDQIYDSINDLLEALGLTLETDEDRNNDGQNDTIIMSGTSELMILQNLEFELSLSNFEVEVI